MTKDEIIDYVMDTPGNTNPNVLRGMLENSGGDGNYKFVEVARQEEFEWTQEKSNVWIANNTSFDVDTLEKNIYAIKMPPYINDFTSALVVNNDSNKLIDVDRSCGYSVIIGDDPSHQNIIIEHLESTPEVESIILYKLVPANEEETAPEAPSSSDSLLEP